MLLDASTLPALARGVYDWHMRRWVALTDLLSVGSSALVAYWLRFGSLPDSDVLVTVGMTIIPVTVAVFALLGLYSRQAAPVTEIGRAVLAVTLSLIGFVFVMFWTDVYVPRSVLGLTWVVATVLVVVSRRAWRLAAT
jgi:FlaA1/EpsC-like NDP-sugar epimerase